MKKDKTGLYSAIGGWVIITYFILAFIFRQ